MFMELCLKEIPKCALAWLLGHLSSQGNAFWRGIEYVSGIFSFGKWEKGNYKRHLSSKPTFGRRQYDL